MSNITPCNLEEVMRGLSISSPDKKSGGGAALNNRLEDGATSDQEAVDEVFVDGCVAEDQQQLLDSTDALLMDATNKMDDTAFLDEVIARNCRSFDSTDDNYIDEVIARCSIIILVNSIEPRQMFKGLSNGPWRICWMVIMETWMAQGLKVPRNFAVSVQTNDPGTWMKLSRDLCPTSNKMSSRLSPRPLARGNKSVTMW